MSASQGRGRGEQILEILFDPSRAAQLGIDLPQTAARLGQANDVSGGFVEVGRRQYALRFTGRYEPRELSAFVLDWRDGRPVKLGDLLLRLVDTQSPEISVNAPLRAARFNPPGSSVQVEAEGQRQTARIRAVVPVGDSLSRMMELRLSLEPGTLVVVRGTERLHDGQAVKVIQGRQMSGTQQPGQGSLR